MTIPTLSIIGFLLVSGWILMTYNRFIRGRALTKEAWSGIDVQLKRRHDLIPNLVAAVKGYAHHEESLFEELAKRRAQCLSASGVQERGQTEGNLSASLRGLIAVTEAYPSLKADSNFRALQDQLANVEEQIQLARRYYNGTVRDYNILVESIPSNLIARICGFQVAESFALEAGSERNVPEATFNR